MRQITDERRHTLHNWFNDEPMEAVMAEKKITPKRPGAAEETPLSRVTERPEESREVKRAVTRKVSRKVSRKTARQA